MFDKMYEDISESPFSKEYAAAQKKYVCTTLASAVAVIKSVHKEGRRFKSIEFSVGDGETTIKLLDFYGKTPTPNIGTADSKVTQSTPQGEER